MGDSMLQCLTFEMSTHKDQKTDFVLHRKKDPLAPKTIDIIYLRKMVASAFHQPDVRSISLEKQGKKLYKVEIMAKFEGLALDIERNLQNHFGIHAFNTKKVEDCLVMTPYKANVPDSTDEDTVDYKNSKQLAPLDIRANNDRITMKVYPSFLMVKNRCFLAFEVSFLNEESKIHFSFHTKYNEKPVTGCRHIYSSSPSHYEHSVVQKTQGSTTESSIDISKAPSARLAHNENKNSTYTDDKVSSTFKLDTNGARVDYIIDKTCKKNAQLNFVHVFALEVGCAIESIPKFGLEIKVNFTKPAFISEIPYSTVFITRLENTKLGKEESVKVGAMMGQPQCGKTTFIRALEDSFANHMDTIQKTLALQRHELQLSIKPFNPTLTLFDTCGYYFEVDDQNKNLIPHDENVLKRFFAGLPEGTKFSKKPEKNPVIDANMYSQNKITHLVFVWSARYFYKPKIAKSGSPWSYSYWWGSKKETVTDSDSIINFSGVKKALVLINQSLKLLETSLKLKAPDSVQNRFAIIISHMDMIPRDKHVEFKKLLEQAFVDVHDSRFFYGMKSCEWREEDLKSHEEEVERILEKVPKGEDYTEVLDDADLKKLHISRNMCTRSSKGCTHSFEKETISNYQKVLDMFVLQ